jgi:Ca2+-binding EF-hand superfamily protein
MDSPILYIFLVEDDSMVGGTEGLGSTILNSFTQKAFQQVQKSDANRSGGLDPNEIKDSVEVTGNGQDLVDNFDSIDTDQSGELSATELIAFRAKSGEGLDSMLDQLQNIFEQSGVSTGSIVEFLSNRANSQNDLGSLLQSSTDLDALIESRVQEILVGSGEGTESQLLDSITNI